MNVNFKANVKCQNLNRENVKCQNFPNVKNVKIWYTRVWWILYFSGYGQPANSYMMIEQFIHPLSEKRINARCKSSYEWLPCLAGYVTDWVYHLCCQEFHSIFNIIVFKKYIMSLSNPCHMKIHPESSQKTLFVMNSFSESKDSCDWTILYLHIQVVGDIWPLRPPIVTNIGLSQLFTFLTNGMLNNNINMLW